MAIIAERYLWALMYNTRPQAGAPFLFPLHESTQNCVEVQGQFHFQRYHHR